LLSPVAFTVNVQSIPDANTYQ